MPLAACWGRPHRFLACRPHLDPAHVAIVGARSWEPRGWSCSKAGVKIFFMPGSRPAACPPCCAGHDASPAPGTAGFGVSVDLDAMGCAALPATTCLVPDGLDRGRSSTPSTDCAAADLMALGSSNTFPERDRDGSGAGWVRDIAAAALGPTTAQLRQRENTFGARNYAPLPVVFTAARGVWLWDVEGRRYLDMMSAYSAVSFGPQPPALVRALIDQASRLASPRGPTPATAAADARTPVGAAGPRPGAAGEHRPLEAVETAIKGRPPVGLQARAWPTDQARIIVCANNFHGRSTTIVGFSSSPVPRRLRPPSRRASAASPGDAAASRRPSPQHRRLLFRAHPGRGGIDPARRLAGLLRRAVPPALNVLLIADGVQTGLGRTSRLLACGHGACAPTA